MTRKPVDKIRPDERREAIWAIIRTVKIFTIADLHTAIDMHRSSISAYVIGLENAGFLVRDTQGTGIGDPAVFRMVRDNGIEAPRVRKDGTEVTQGRGREQMWLSMRILKTFTAPELAVNASTEDCIISESEAKCYVQYLFKAGYLTCIRKGKPGGFKTPGTPARYLFVKARHTGPKPPMIQRIKQVYDPNLKKVVWPELSLAEARGSESRPSENGGHHDR